MHVVIAGGHGQIALLLSERLAEAGHRVTGLIRDADQSGDLEARGASARVLDLEGSDLETVGDAIEGADGVVFAAGAGPGSGKQRKLTVDLGAAVTLADAAAARGVSRYVMISSMGADDPPGVDPSDPDVETFDVYLDAKAGADRHLRASGLAWTILRPGRLTDDPGSGLVELAPTVERGGVPRADVAAVLAAILEEPGTAGLVLELVSGSTPVADAVAAVAAAS